MIKRRFYKIEHGDGDAPSASSSSDSDNQVEADDASNPEKAEIEDEEEEQSKPAEFRNSSSSGYETEDSSGNLDSSGFPWSDDDTAAAPKEVDSSSIVAEEAPQKPSCSVEDVKDCILKIKSVFKCRLCPKVLCLSEESLKAHLNSKKHARAERLCLEGRLKVMLDANGKIVGQTEPENYEQIFAAKPKRKKSSSGPFKEKKRARQEKRGKRMQEKCRKG